MSAIISECCRYRYRLERDAALARVAELEAKLSDPTAVHQWQFSNAWFDGSEEVVLKAGKEGSPIRTLYTAPVAHAQHSVPDGYALVPLEPTDDMLVAGQEAWTHKMERRGALEDCEEAGDVYRAMLAAAPGKEGL
ncbi:TPA: hypothetical protein VDW15_004472 [Pseudomonas aeruginosa]|nr:hypothetical protein [Pseudomonas aeruginosa]